MMDLQTPIEYFYDWEMREPNRIFLRQPYGNTWETFSYAQVGEEARKMANGLNAMGLKKGDHIGIISKNCYHWIIADLAIMMGGFVSVPFYASLTRDQLSEVVLKGDVKLLFVGKLDKWEDHALGLPSDIQIIRFPHYEGNATVSEGVSWDEIIMKSEPTKENFIPNIDSVWSILFTSGTTGSPKGAMLPHRSPATIIAHEVQHKQLGIAALKDVQLLSFLPLNHVGERIAIEMLCLLMGGTISFVENINTFGKNLYDTQPTFFFAVPRIWNKIQKGIFDKIPEITCNILFSIPIISTLFVKLLRKKLGFGNLEITLTGAALTPSYLKEWYRKLGLNLREVYGMTECCGSATLTPIGEFSADNVGKPFYGFELKIEPNSGEVLYKSSQQMIGYYNDPEKTKDVIKDGWIHSGDKGSIDENGNLRIVGRISDAFKTTKGKFITPNLIEEELSKYPMVEQVCVVGLGIEQPIALINVTEAAKSEPSEAIEAPLIDALQKLNTSLANFEKVSTIVITKETWTDQNNLLTPTLKTKRGKIDEKYAPFYQQWHNHDKKVIWER